MKPLHHSRAKKWRMLRWIFFADRGETKPWFMRGKRRLCDNCGKRAIAFAAEETIRGNRHGYTRTVTVVTQACADCLSLANDDIMDLIARTEKSNEAFAKRRKHHE